MTKIRGVYIISGITPYFHVNVFLVGVCLIAAGLGAFLRARWLSRQLISTWTEAGLPKFLLFPLPGVNNERATEIYQRTLTTLGGGLMFLMGWAFVLAALFLPVGRHQ